MTMKICPSAAINALFFIFFFIFFFASAGGQQVSTSCTSQIISSFTPCLNFLTSSTNGGGSPSGDCCGSLASLISSGTQCACLILTGAVPLNLPINRTLAVSLPRLCKSRSVPLKCSTDVGTPIPGPGPVSYSPSLPPLPNQPTTPAVSTDAPPPSVVSSSPSQPAAQSPPSISNTPASQDGQGLQPLILPNSAVKISILRSSVVGTVFMLIIVLSF